MMAYTIFLLEDDVSQIKSIQALIADYSTQSGISIDLLFAANLDAAKKIILTFPQIDVFLLEISLHNTSYDGAGIHFAEFVQQFTKYRTKPLIFLTIYGDYMPHALNRLHCFSFILKPYTSQELFRQLDDLLLSRDETLLLKNLDGVYMKLLPEYLVYIHSNGRYLKYHTLDDILHSRQYSMQRLEELLPEYFFRCHRSYIVNKIYIDNFDFRNHIIHLATLDVSLPISRKISSVDFVSNYMD